MIPNQTKIDVIENPVCPDNELGDDILREVELVNLYIKCT